MGDRAAILGFDVFDLCLDGVLIFNKDLKVVYVNQALTHISGLSEKRWLKVENVLDVLKAEALRDLLGHLDLSFEGSPYREFQVHVVGGRDRVTAQIALKRVGVEKSGEEKGEGPLWILFLRDATLEETLHKKYHAELSKKEEMISRLDRKIFETSTLYEISQGLAKATTLEEILSCIMQKVMEVTGYHVSIVLLPNEKGEVNVFLKNNNGFSIPDRQKDVGLKRVLQFLSDQLESVRLLVYSRGQDVEVDQWIRSMGLGQAEMFLALDLPLKHGQKGYILVLSQILRAAPDEDSRGLLETVASQLASAIETFQYFEYSIKDNLTGLHNTRYFKSVLPKEVERSLRVGYAMGLSVIDVDFFKKFNDTYGHQAGDEVLAQVARVIKATARKSDVVARYGGEEFVCLHIDVNAEGLLVVAERIRQAVEQMEIRWEGHLLKVTVSVGASVFEAGTKLEEFFQQADKALYMAKNAGRNRVQLWHIAT